MAELARSSTLPKVFVDPHVSTIQRNALLSWQRLAPAVEVLVDGRVTSACAEEALAHGGRTSTTSP